MYKLKFTARLEVNPTFGSGEIRFLNPGGHIVPPPRPNREDFLDGDFKKFCIVLNLQIK